jgi:hypothetical protein
MSEVYYDINKLDNIDTDPEIKEIVKDIIEEHNACIPVIKEPKPKKERKSFKQRCEEDPDFYQKTKDKLKEKVVCKDCNAEVSKSSLSEHNKTKKHIRNTIAKAKNDEVNLLEKDKKDKINKFLDIMYKVLTENEEQVKVEVTKVNEQTIKVRKPKPSSVENAKKAREVRLKKYQANNIDG